MKPNKAALATARYTTIDALQPMFAKAIREGLVFYNKWQNRYFTPDELANEIRAGRYIWGQSCWQLRQPIVNG